MMGSFSCFCNEGFMLMDDDRTCVGEKAPILYHDPYGLNLVCKSTYFVIPKRQFSHSHVDPCTDQHCMALKV